MSGKKQKHTAARSNAAQAEPAHMDIDGAEGDAAHAAAAAAPPSRQAQAHSSDDDDAARSRAWFESYLKALGSGSVRGREEGPYRCPCCHKLTLGERGGFEICPVCFWEDDGQDEHDADVVRGGPNGALSLSQARESYLRIGACEERVLPHVRPPRPEED